MFVVRAKTTSRRKVPESFSELGPQERRIAGAILNAVRSDEGR